MGSQSIFQHRPEITTASISGSFVNRLAHYVCGFVILPKPLLDKCPARSICESVVLNTAIGDRIYMRSDEMNFKLLEIITVP